MKTNQKMRFVAGLALLQLGLSAQALNPPQNQQQNQQQNPPQNQQQNPPPPPPGPDNDHHRFPPQPPEDRFLQTINLNPDQKAKVEAMNNQYKHQMDSLHTAMKQAQHNFQEGRRKIQDAKLAQLKTVLTPEQYTQLLESLNKMRQDRKDKRHPDPTN